MLKLMYITNRPEVAAAAERAGVDSVMVDLERLGKAERQGGMDTVQNAHTVADVAAVRAALTGAELVARCNPVHDELSGFPSTEDEVGALVDAGADAVILPYFHACAEAERFLAALSGRARAILLFETREAVADAARIAALPGVDEAYVGLNDLSLARGDAFMFGPLADGTVERLSHVFRAAGVPFGFGGVAAVNGGLLPGTRVIREHYRLGSSRVILSRSFCNAERVSLAEVERAFAEGVAAIRACEAECEARLSFFADNAAEVRAAVAEISAARRVVPQGTVGGARGSDPSDPSPAVPAGAPTEPPLVLLTGAVPEAGALAARLEGRGLRTLLMPDERGALSEGAELAEASVCNSLLAFHDPSELPRLRLVQLTSAGTDRVPVAELEARGVRVLPARGVYSGPMAEHVVCVSLMLLRRAPDHLRSQAARRWEKVRDARELAGLPALVVGCGSVGCAVAARLSAMGCVVAGVDPDDRPRPSFARVVPPARLDAELARAGLTVLCAPLTPETRGMMDAARLAAMPRGSLLVNVSRGAIVDEEALASALASGRLAGAALDVFETEPLPASSPLWGIPNVIVTPHDSFVGDRDAARLHDLAVSNLAALSASS